MANLGQQLKQQRERRGVVLEQVHASTKIKKRYLEALERQDWDVFPGTVFAQGYLRTYAEYLGLDPQRVLKAYARERRIQNPAQSAADEAEAERREAVRAMLDRLARTQGVDHVRRRRALWRAAAGLAATAVVAAALWGVQRARSEGGEPPVAEAPAAGSRGPIAAREPAREPGAVPLATEAPRPAPSPASISALATPGAPDPGATKPAPPEAAAAPGDPAGHPRATFVAAPAPSHLSIAQHGVGRRIVGQELADESREFVEGQVVWFWTRVVGGQRGDRVHHVWIHDGRRADVIELELGGPQWRTRSRRKLTAGAAGEWTVEAQDPSSGQVLASASFRVVPR